MSDNPPGSYAARLEQLIHFNFLQVPILAEQSNSFVLSSRLVDIFKPERDAQQEAQSAAARQVKAAMDAQTAIYQKQKIDKRRQSERQRIQEILDIKKFELNEAEDRRARDMEQVARGVKLDLTRLDYFIALTNSEISQFQKDLDAVEELT